MAEFVKCEKHSVIHRKDDECRHCLREQNLAALPPKPRGNLFDITGFDESDRTPGELAPATREVAAFLSDLEDLQNDDRYTWALGTIEGIHETVTRTNRVSDAQRQAIDNIRAKVEKGYR